MTKIVVVDDRVSNRNILTRLAQTIEEGVQTDSFASPNQALASLTKGPVADLIVTDFNMPGMDGAQFISTLRRERAYEDVPIIVVTAYEDREYCYRALEAGATDFLLNPVDHLEFRARAHNLLLLRRQSKMLAAKAESLERALLEQRQITTIEPDELTQAYLDLLPASVCIVDNRNTIQLVNRAQENLFQKSRRDVIGLNLEQAYGEAYALRHRVLNEKVLQTGKAIPVPHQETHGEGASARAYMVCKTPVTEHSAVDRIVTMTVDITTLDFGHTMDCGQDPLTGLANLSSFNATLEEALKRARRDHDQLAVLLLDLDRFKGINDAFNEKFGDQLLRTIASRLAQRLSPGDVLARRGSDEFLILCREIRTPEDAAELSRRLSKAFAEPFLIEDKEVHLSASIGITIFPGDGKTDQVMLKNADLAMYRAKASGRDCYRFFATEMNIAARRAVTLERELRQALAGNQFMVYFQPQIDILTRGVIGMEALVRWNHPYRGIVSPGEFIDLAEDIGLIAPLTAWVLRHACEQHRRWIIERSADLQLSVNLSPVQFRERGIELVIERILRETKLEPTRLDIELTENAVIHNNTNATASLKYLNKLGVTLSIDDFGTGYSSLSYVKRLPVQRLKIDRSFVCNLESDNHDDAIVRAIINLGHSLGLRVIAEGVETNGQLERLRRLGCDQAQGHIISPPLCAADFAARFLDGIDETLPQAAIAWN